MDGLIRIVLESFANFKTLIEVDIIKNINFVVDSE